MASTTALPRHPVLRRTVTSTTAESSPSTAVASPSDSPRQSPSTSSLTSMSSLEETEDQGYGKLTDTLGNQFELPDYTVNDIRNAIPKHCYERSGLTGLMYVARDIVYLGTTFAIFNKFVTPEYIPSTPIRAALWALYTVLQGLFATGIWVLAHECGHQSFSPSKVLNDTTGWVLHSALLVPYFSWKISHGKHHKATGNMERDMVFVPKTREQYSSRIGKFVHELDELTEETPIATAFHSVLQQLFGWPLYLFANVTGHDNHHKQHEGRGKGKANGYFGGVNHFNPSSPLYEAKDAKLILLSDAGLAITITALVTLCKTYGFNNMLVWYFIPYLWVNHWLVAITYLQHTDPTLPHYNAESWNYVRGAAATIDREFGFVGRHLLHGIIETHVLHHYVSTIPFYHADEASEAIKPIMGRHYRSDTEGGSLGFLKSLWTSARWCQWVEPSEGAVGEGKGVYFFRNRNGLGVKPMKLQPSVGRGKSGMVIGADE
ncbi:putative oleate delta-12 desaturase [Venustampulla echinocandica]|uniref:Putative oleate delta-12 desaturase n=1 Tax=Venustampulla echinocandica TaxID=2656787 RepID=A0A370TH78_9HELO|nr:putative oleate delta-12 desaturase [Venustampulla echinocandica]RDL34552.1 putative oleate delta-12 desaturase [Venustampulla echinocandica]